MKKLLVFCLLLGGVFSLRAQPNGTPDNGQVIKLYENASAGSPESELSITVFLPDADKACGAAAIICPGGGFAAYDWVGDVMPLVEFLNERGIAAIGLKYHLRPRNGGGNMPAPGARPAAAPSGNAQAPKPLRVTITEFDQLHKANAHPMPSMSPEPTILSAIDDAMLAMNITKQNAAKWHIDPAKIGYVGFSAGGGVVVGATVKATEQTRPAFLCTLYGPALMDVDVPQDAPKLFIGVHADHPNVAAGCMALFMEWKKAGREAEMHIYGNYTGGMYGGNNLKDRNTPNGSWKETFYSWLVANELL